MIKDGLIDDEEILLKRKDEKIDWQRIISTRILL